MYGPGNSAQPGAGRHGQRNFRYHFAGMQANHSGTQDSIGSYFNIDIQKTLVIGLKDGTINRIHFNRDGIS